MPPVRMRGDGRKAKAPKQTLLRLLGYMKKHIPTLVVVLVCIFMASYAQTAGSAALGKLVDDYILPMVRSGVEDYGPLSSQGACSRKSPGSWAPACRRCWPRPWRRCRPPRAARTTAI